MTCHVLCTGVNFDAGNDSCVGDRFKKGSTIFLLLANRLVELFLCFAKRGKLVLGLAEHAGQIFQILGGLALQ